MTKEISITYLMASLAVLQWLVGPVVYFSDLNPGMVIEISKMQVGYEEYFAFAFPATVSFCIGLCLFKVSDLKLQITIDKIKQKLPQLSLLARNLIIIAFLADILLPLVPVAIRQYVTFIGYLKYMGLALLFLNAFFNRSRKSLIYVCLSGFLIILMTIKSLMFGDFVFAIALISLIVLPFIKTRFIYRISSIVLLTLTIIVIQLVKPISRAYYWEAKGETSMTGLVHKIKNNKILSVDNLKSEGFMGYSIARFNQGSVVSWTMSRVPRNVPFENGKTIISSTLGSFIPRLVWPSKPVAGKAMYQKYTGLDLKSSSYGISQLGEAYVNFGSKGSILFMFILGLVFNQIQNRIVIKSDLKLALLFILPIIFLHGIKVETDITRSLGFIIRFLIFLGILNWGLTTFTSKRIF